MEGSEPGSEPGSFHERTAPCSKILQGFCKPYMFSTHTTLKFVVIEQNDGYLHNSNGLPAVMFHNAVRLAAHSLKHSQHQASPCKVNDIIVER